MDANQEEARRQRILELMREFEDQGDRVVSIVAGAYLDQLLCDLLQATAKVNEKIIDEYLCENLGSFYKRINVCAKVELITSDEKHDLHKIREVRNSFAHVFSDLTFGDERMASRCESLRVAQIDGRPETSRECFVKAASRLMVDIFLRTQEIE
jgi:hypothetical protein